MKKRSAPVVFSCGPGLAWIVTFLLLPLCAVVVISFLSRGEYGDVRLPFTFENYRRLIGFGSFGFDPVYLLIFGRSILLATVTTALCVLLGLPLAFFIAGLSPRWKGLALTLVIVPFWINLLIRTYAWQIMLGPNAIVSHVLVSLGLLEEGNGLAPGVIAVYVGNLCDYLPYFVLPLYSSVEKIDWRIAEAARDLGATSRDVFRHALYPQIVPGLAAGVVLVFVPAIGQFVIPDLLGGAKTALLGNSIAQQFGPSRDWPFGSAISVVAMIFVMLGLRVYAKKLGEKGQEHIL